MENRWFHKIHSDIIWPLWENIIILVIEKILNILFSFTFQVRPFWNINWKNAIQVCLVQFRDFFCKFEHPTKLSFIHSLLHLVQQKFLPQIGLFFLSVAIVNSLIFQGTFNLQMEKVPSKFLSFFFLLKTFGHRELRKNCENGIGEKIRGRIAHYNEWQDE